MQVPDGFRLQKLGSALAPALPLEPPGWTRLEPQSVSGDPTPGIEARVHDPLWLLGRQWQLGEYAGADAGSPLAVQVTSSSAFVTGCQPGDPSDARPVLAVTEGELLEPLIEREPTPVRGPGLRQRAQAGSQLVAQLAEAGAADARDALLASCPLTTPWSDPFDTRAPELLSLLGGRVPDGEAAARAIELGDQSEPPALPDWLEGRSADVVAAARDWLAWYRAAVAPAPAPDLDAWVDERLEYRFSLGVDLAGGQLVLRAASFTGGRADWYVVDHDPDAAPLEPPDAVPAAPLQRDQTVLATPLRFAGMPADRYWEFEDAAVNLGALQTQPHDLARLALVEFAMVYGNDWLAVPLDVPYGSWTTIDQVRYLNTFNEQIAVPAADDAGRPGQFSLYRVSEAAESGAAEGLFVPPTAAQIQEGTPREETLFLRDQVAMMAWAVERVVEGPSGDPRNRQDEPPPAPPTPGTEPGAELDYLLQTEVPDRWIPFLSSATGIRALALRKGAMVRGGEPVEPLGVLLKPGEALVLRDEEVPREGVRVRRTPALARRADGTYARWLARRVTVGRGEGASGLRFDVTVRRQVAVSLAAECR